MGLNPVPKEEEVLEETGASYRQCCKATSNINCRDELEPVFLGRGHQPDPLVIDFEVEVLSIPETKNGKPHSLPITPMMGALELIQV